MVRDFVAEAATSVMDGQQFKIAISALGFASLNQFAQWIEVNDRTAARWVENGPPKAVAIILEMMQASDHQVAIMLDDLRSITSDTSQNS